MKTIKLTCSKHKDEELDDFTMMCKRCRELRDYGLCLDCEQHKGTVDFCSSVLEWTHGFAIKICQCCYVKRIETELAKCKKNLNLQKQFLLEKGCQ